jgi:hypothetical protein
MNPLHHYLCTKQPLYGLRRIIVKTLPTSIRSLVANYGEDHPQVKSQDKEGILFVHIPKCAGSAIEAALDISGSAHATCHFHQLRMSKGEYDRLFKFCFVRNPYSRFYSIYRYLIYGGERLDDNSRYSNHQIFGDNPTFEEFTKTVEKLDLVNNHQFFKPMSEFVSPLGSDKILVDFVGKFEQINADYNLLRDKLGYGKDLKTKNVSVRHGDDLQAVYTSYCKETINHLYQKDFRLFNYDLF